VTRSDALSMARILGRALVSMLVAALRQRAREAAARRAEDAVPGRTTWHHERGGVRA
jgi:hypothetical protein